VRNDLGIRGLLADYHSGRRAPADVLRAAHTRARRSDQPVWITLLDWEAIAGYLDRLGPLRSELPLYGIPFAIKDNIDLAGTPTTAGCPEFARVPPASAFVANFMGAENVLPVHVVRSEDGTTVSTGPWFSAAAWVRRVCAGVSTVVTDDEIARKGAHVMRPMRTVHHQPGATSTRRDLSRNFDANEAGRAGDQYPPRCHASDIRAFRAGE